MKTFEAESVKKTDVIGIAFVAAALTPDLFWALLPLSEDLE